MNTRSPVVLLVVFLVVTVILVVSILNTHTTYFPGVELKLTLITRTLGAVIAVMAALVLLLRAISGTSLSQLLPLTLPLLAGLLLVSVHWSLGVALGALGIAVIAKEVVATLKDKPGGSDPG